MSHELCSRSTSCRSTGGCVATGGVLAIALLAAGCATNPATGERQLMLVSTQQEIEIGRETARQAEATFGLVSNDDLQNYVSDLGRRLAAKSERPDLPWSFRVVDDPAVNAFAAPGGFIYVTRGLLAHLGSEAELVAVLGHELGHVTARHSAQRLSKAQLATLGLGIGTIIEPELARYGELAETGLGVLFLKFSRDDEREADALGMRYLTGLGYDADAMRRVLRTLQRVGEESDGGAMPNWLSTHPSPQDRLARLRATAEGRMERAGYLRKVDGLVFGSDPRHGFFEGATFYHPELRFRLDFPRGWRTSNSARAVTAVSPQNDAAMELGLASAGSARAAASAFAGRDDVVAGQAEGRSGDVGIAFDARDGSVRGRARFVEHRSSVIRILAYAAPARWQEHERSLVVALASFRELSDRRYLDVAPRRLDVVSLDRAANARELADRYPSSVDADTLALINGIEPDERLPAGSLAKRVVGGSPPR